MCNNLFKYAKLCERIIYQTMEKEKTRIPHLNIVLEHF